MPPDVRFAAALAGVFLLALMGLVHVSAPVDVAVAGRAERKAERKGGKETVERPHAAPQVRYGTEQLPAPVRDMREAILSAVRSGRIEDLRLAVELNEMKPAIADKAVGDPIAYWKQISADGEGREILALLGEVLDAGYVTLPIGRDLENNLVYVWPYFAELSPDKLAPAQEVELLRLVPAEAAAEMKKAGRYTFYRLGIGADGTWHFFLR